MWTICGLYGLWYLPVILTNRKQQYFYEEQGDLSESIPVSVIIACRNEEHNVPQLLKTLSHLQPAPSEVILVDDSSTDNTLSLLKQSDYTVIANTSSPGKKNALKLGIESAQQNTIFTMDADCYCASEHLGMFFLHHRQFKYQMTIGLVEYTPTDSWIKYYQWLESRAIMAVGAAWWKMGLPVLANGANLMFEKSAFFQVQGYEGFEKAQGGDDVFLLHKFYKIFGKASIGLSTESVVLTAPKSSFIAFMRQRKRWASKLRYYKLPHVWIFSMMQATFGVAWAAAIVWMLMHQAWAVAASALIIKSLIDYAVLYSFKAGFTQCISFVMVIQNQLIQIFYPLGLIFFGSDWKPLGKK